MLKQELEEQFDQYGVTISDPIIEKCLELCVEYSISNAAEFVENWMAYTINKLNGADPKVTTIAEMVRQEYEKLKENKRVLKLESKKLEMQDGKEMLKVYGKEMNNDVDDMIMDSYCEPTSPKRKVAKPSILKTPNTSQALFSPASFSPLPLTDPRPLSVESVLCTFGRAQLVKECQWTQYRNGNLNIQLFDIGNFEYISTHTKCMFDTLSMRASIESEELQELGKQIYERIKLVEKSPMVEEKNSKESGDIVTNTKLDISNSKSIECIGRIITNSDKISCNNVCLVGLNPDESHIVNLDLSKCKNYSLYPGQVVMVKGMKVRGNTIVVDGITSVTNITYSSAPIIKSVPLSIIATSGPYTANDNLSFQPLQNLVKYCQTNQPDILIMTGSFLSTKGSALVNMADHFDIHFARIIEQLVQSLSPKTHILIVSSHEDANSTFFYPTHPYESQHQYNNVHLLPDPCIVDVEGVHIGITSTDTLSALANNELSYNEGADSIKRSIFHMFHKKTFYPLRPATIPLDTDLAHKFAQLNVLPNLLIMPSEVKEFIRDYNNCLCINPGRLYNEKGVGKFAKVVLHPTDSPTAKFFNYAAGQVVKIEFNDNDM